jgi:hypothetical protein
LAGEPHRHPLANRLSQLNPDQVPILFFEARDPKALPTLREVVEQAELEGKTIFCSRQDGLLKDLRELEPTWTFCNGEAYLVRLLTFSSLGLESLLDLPSDVMFIHQAAKLNAEEMQSLIKEGRRQNKLVLVGPVPRPLEGLTPHGWVVENTDPKVE